METITEIIDHVRDLSLTAKSKEERKSYECLLQILTLHEDNPDALKTMLGKIQRHFITIEDMKILKEKRHKDIASLRASLPEHLEVVG